MSAGADTFLLLRAFVDELVRCGMQAACTSPGSRCAPLVLSLAREPRLRCYSHVDERCAGFFALGLAKASGVPVAVACTSGTAAGELLPAAIEAHEARVPLILLSADRPAELRENGAGQTIDQLKLFGEAAKWFFEVETDSASEARLRWIRMLACRAYWTALYDRPGAVHLNFPLRDPLVSDDPLPEDPTGRPGGEPYVRRSARAGLQQNRPDPVSELTALLGSARKGVIVAGRDERQPQLGPAAAELAAAAGWPLLADPLSGARRGSAAVAHYDALLRDASFASANRPDAVLRVGDLPVSKPLRGWLASLGDVPQVALDPEGAWQDPDAVLSLSLDREPATALRQARLSGADPDWLAAWRSGDEIAAEAILGELAQQTISEPRLAAELGVLLPRDATLFVASSMPVRDIETFWPVREDPPRVLCNRGANGIDGTVSSAFGAAAHADGPVVLLIGDVAFAHDIGGLLAARRLGLRLTIVLVDNGGGGIFDFLPVAHAGMGRASDSGPAEDGDRPGGAREDARSQEDVYTRHIATPTGLDFVKAADLYGLTYERVQTVPAFREALERALAPRADATIIYVHGDRAANVNLHRRVWSAVSSALADGGA